MHADTGDVFLQLGMADYWLGTDISGLGNTVWAQKALKLALKSRHRWHLDMAPL